MWCCCHLYIKRSRLNENFKHSSVACERSDIANSQTHHSESFFGTASVAVKLPINKDRSMFEFHQHNMWSLYIWCVSKHVKSFNLLSLSTSSNKVKCYWAIHIMWILNVVFMQEMKTNGLILLMLHFYTLNIFLRHVVTNERTTLCTWNISWLCSWIFQVLVQFVKNHPCAGYMDLNFDYPNKTCGTLWSSMWLNIQLAVSMVQVIVQQTCVFIFAKSDWRNKKIALENCVRVR